MMAASHLGEILLLYQRYFCEKRQDIRGKYYNSLSKGFTLQLGFHNPISLVCMQLSFICVDHFYPVNHNAAFCAKKKKANKKQSSISLSCNSRGQYTLINVFHYYAYVFVPLMTDSGKISHEFSASKLSKTIKQ